ncbi:hypothetical protein [Nostoc sp.]|uniref:hypothetical protein n=1 Tax=Nostoc sp. TaxID=1180 RepID=UPI002FFA43CD
MKQRTHCRVAQLAVLPYSVLLLIESLKAIATSELCFSQRCSFSVVAFSSIINQVAVLQLGRCTCVGEKQSDVI